MDVALYYTAKRDLTDLTLFDDLFTTPDYTGYDYDEAQGANLLHFDGDLTDAQRDAVIVRVYTTPEEETQRKRAEQAIADNTAWRNNVHPQVISGADQIIAAGSSSTQEKELAKAVKTLANQMDDVLAQNNAIIRLTIQNEAIDTA